MTRMKSLHSTLGDLDSVIDKHPYKRFMILKSDLDRFVIALLALLHQ
jgi:hypothetical protein